MMERAQTKRDYLTKDAMIPFKVSRKTLTKAVIAVTILVGGKGVGEISSALSIQESQVNAFKEGYHIVNKYIPPKNASNFSIGFPVVPDIYSDIMGEQVDLSDALKSRIEEDIEASNNAHEKKLRGIYTNPVKERCLIASKNWAKIYTAIENNPKYVIALKTQDFSKLTLSEKITLDYWLTSMDFELKNIKYLENKQNFTGKQIMNSKEEIKILAWKRLKLRWMKVVIGK